jgi:Domain of unknown function (DUF4124)
VNASRITSPFIRLLGLVAAFALSAFAGVASAQSSIYTCRDHNGHTLTSDRPIADCAGTMRELGPSGIVKREIAPPLTPEQQKAKEDADRAKRLTEETVREQHRRDLALLTAYQSEDQIDAARKRALADPDATIKGSQSRLVELAEEKQALAKEVETYKGKVPPIVQRRVDDNQALIDDETATIKSRNVEIVRINQRYDDDRKRFRELTATSKK